MANNTNIAWLRNIGSSIVGLLFFGYLSIYNKKEERLTIFKIMTVTSLLQIITIIYSRFNNEFSAKNFIVIDLSIFLAVFVCILFVLILSTKRHVFS